MAHEPRRCIADRRDRVHGFHRGPGIAEVAGRRSPRASWQHREDQLGVWIALDHHAVVVVAIPSRVCGSMASCSMNEYSSWSVMNGLAVHPRRPSVVLGGDGALLDHTNKTWHVHVFGSLVRDVASQPCPMSTSVVNIVDGLAESLDDHCQRLRKQRPGVLNRLPAANSLESFPNPISSRYFNVSLLKLTDS